MVKETCLKLNLLSHTQSTCYKRSDRVKDELCSWIEEDLDHPKSLRTTKHSRGERSLGSANMTAGQETEGDSVLQHPNGEQSGNTRICQRHRRACHLLSLIQENLSVTQSEDSPHWLWSRSVCTGLSYRALHYCARRHRGEKSSAF